MSLIKKISGNMLEKRKPISAQKYILTFCFTVIIFGLGFFVSDYLNDKRFSEINTMKQEFQIQVLGMEAQLAHFEEILCPDIGDDILTHELHVIGEKLEFMANSLGYNHPEVLHLKKYYSLLQIRHYHFSQQLSERCDLRLVHILYFFANEEYCHNCEKQGAILTHLRREEPSLRIYSFDYKLDLPALAIIKPIIPIEYLEPKLKPSVYNRENLDLEIYPDSVKKYLPIIVINGEPHFGFRSLQEMKELLEFKY
ncbi:hypothetical protein M1N50_00245 [Dehalococcoidia bacterium]|nr:hypothetical protein [Dehalococcoidia bacterium]